MPTHRPPKPAVSANTFRTACVSVPYYPRALPGTTKPHVTNMEPARPEGTLRVWLPFQGHTFDAAGAARMPGDTVYWLGAAYEVLEVVNGVEYVVVPWDEYPPIPEPVLTAENAHEMADAMHGTGSYPAPIRDKAWAVAYEEHHAYGLAAVVNEYGEIADILHWAFKLGMAAAQ